MLRQDDLQKSQLVLEGWRQGLEYGGHLASCLVMSCIANRVKRGWGTWLDVIARIPLYSAELIQPNRDVIPVIWEPNFTRLLHEVEAIYDGSRDHSKTASKTEGALYWCDLRRVDTDFFKSKILGQPNQHPRIADMGSLALFS